MYVCNYCGRYLKNEYDVCPGWGSHSFKKVQEKKEKVIKTPPKDGYKINMYEFESKKQGSGAYVVVGIFLIIFIIAFTIPFLSGGFSAMKVDPLFGIGFIAMPILFLFIFMYAGYNMFKTGRNNKVSADRDIARVTKLAKEGMLIKNMDYKLRVSKDASLSISNPRKAIEAIQLLCIEVKYENKEGKVLTLRSEPKVSPLEANAYETADLLIDPNDETNYFIDFEIY